MFLLAASMFPKIGALIAVMPAAVLGGAAILMFAMIATSGLVLISKDTLNRRNLLVVALSLGFASGSDLSPVLWYHFRRRFA